VSKKKIQTDRRASYGTLVLAEEQDGSLSPHFQIEETDGVNPELIERIKFGLAGLGYLWERDAETIERLGMAYLEGIEYGSRQAQEEDNEKPKMGFRAKLKDEK
jgi:hypothetical protein